MGLLAEGERWAEICSTKDEHVRERSEEASRKLTPRKLRNRRSNSLRHSLLGSGEGASAYCVGSDEGWMAA
jgi:hypothetical protein